MPLRPSFSFLDLRTFLQYFRLLVIFLGGVWLVLARHSTDVNHLETLRLLRQHIGYDFGILSGRIFAMMVVMTFVTTFMTGPLLRLVRK
jgi:hypothetical protein